MNLQKLPKFFIVHLVVNVRRLIAWARRHPLAPSGGRARLVGLLAAALILIGSGTVVTLDRLYGVPAGAVFRIGDVVLTEQQLDHRMKILNVLYGITPPPPTDAVKLDSYRRDSAKAIAVSMVLDDAARAKGIVIADKKANDELNDLINKVDPQGQDAFFRNLESSGLNRQDVVDEIKRQLVDAELYEEVTKNVSAPSDQDVSQYFQEHKSEMVTPESRHLRNIVVATQDQANQIHSQLAAGADFTSLAAQFSLDDSTKSKGGDLGTVTRDQLEPAYAAAAFNAPNSAIYGPVKTQYGWNVGQVLQIAPSSPLTLDQVRDQLRTTLLNQCKQDLWNKWLGDQLKSVHVRYAPDYRPPDPDSPAAEQATTPSNASPAK